MRHIVVLILVIFIAFSSKISAQTVSFNAPDTVCKGQNITISNTSTGQSSNLWNFCKQSPTSIVTGVNLGSSNISNRPHGIQIYKDGNNYIGILGNDGVDYLRILNFGTSILNTPTVITLSSVTTNLKFPKAIKENNNWYVITVGGYSNDQILILDFGNSLLNTPTVTRNLYSLGGLISVNENLSGVSLEKSGNNIVAMVSTFDGASLIGRIYRINFGASITNPTPAYTALGNFGVFTRLNTAKYIENRGNWYGFVSNDGYPNNPTQDKLYRLDFGNSLLNTPSVTSLGNPNGLMNRVYDFLLYNDCESVKMIGANLGDNTLVEFLFPLGVTSNSVNARTLGNVGSLSQPSGLSQVMIENNQKYVFITNATSNSLSRMNLSIACNSIGVPSSTQTNPPVFVADSVGTMTVSLTINKNLSTEASTCKEIVVIDTIKKPDARINTISCSTDSIRLTIANIDPTATYSWTGPNGFTSTRPNVSIKFNGNNTQNGNYIVTTTGRCGSKKDTVNVSVSCVVCTPTFNAPDTVCKGQNITITNTTTCQSSNLWNFCKQTPNSVITGLNIGGNGLSSRPSHIDVYKDGLNYIGFVSNEQTWGAGVRRLNFGANLLNTTPTVDVLSTFSGQLDGPKGMQFINEAGNWYGFFVADNWTAGYNYQLIRLNFGSSLLNTPTMTNLGTLGGIINEYLGDIAIEKTTQGFIGFISTASGNLFRINFGNDITSTPIATNLGAIGGAKSTVSINLFQRNGNWYLFMPKDDNVPPTNSYLVNLKFGTSLLNTPTVTNFGNPGNLLNRAYDFLPFIDCESLKGYVLAPGTNKIVEYTFPQDINSTTLIGRDIGNVANFSFPSDFSNIQIYNNEKYVFITNQSSNTISRVKLSSNCIPVGVPSSTQTNPPVFRADSVGTMTVSLTIDKNLSTEASTCREIVVIDTIKKPDARINTISCSTDSIRLTIANIDPTATYSWTGPNGFTATRPNVSIKFNGVNQAGQYIVTATGRCGIKKDTVSFVQPTNISVNIGRDSSICQGQTLTLNATTSGTTVTYLWSTGAQTPTITVNQVGTYWVKVTSDGCSASDTMRLTILTPPTAFSIGRDTMYCGNFSRVLSTGNASTVWSTGATASQITVTQAGTYIATITNTCGFKKDTIVITQNNIPLVNIGRDSSICQGQTLTLNATTSGTTVTYLWSTGAQTPTITVNQGGTYWVKVTSDGCSASDTMRLTILTPPTAFSIGRDTMYCGNFSRVLSTGNASTVWSTGATASQITVTQAGTYIATITNTCGFKKDTIVITQNNIPLVNIGRDSSICQGQTLTLNATTSGTTVTYLWSTGAQTPTITVNQGGTYWVKVTSDGCSASDTMRLTILTPPTAFSIGRDTMYCGNFSRVLSTGNASTVWSTGATASQITVTQAGTYIATITNTCGFKKDTIVITQNNIPLVNIGRDSSICQGQTLTLNATTSGTTVTYLWSTGAQTPTITVNQGGTYWVKVTSDGCSASDTMRLTILTPPTAFSIGRDTMYCGNFSRVLSTGNASTVWSTGATASQITVTQAGTYIATITNTCGFKKDTIVITQNNIPLVNIGRDSSICQGQTLTLNATTSGTIVTYLWSTVAQTPTIIVNQTGTYWVKVTSDGCSASDTMRLTILTPPSSFSIGRDTMYCGNFNRVLSTGNASTVWSTGATASQITVTQAGTYIATIKNICGEESDTIVIDNNTIPTVTIDKDTFICVGNTIELKAITSAQNFVWNTGDTTRNINIKQFGVYWVEVSNNGCNAIDTAFVDECEGDLWVPNAFTPNNDGNNDIFQVFGKKVIEYKIIVFSRWGERIFESNNINNSWNGTYKGEPAQVDVYAWVIYYKIQLEGRVEEKMKKGAVTLLR